MVWRRGSRPRSCTARRCSERDRTAASSRSSLRRRDNRRRSMAVTGRMASRTGWHRRRHPPHRSSRFRSCRPFPSDRLTASCPPRMSSGSARRGTSASLGNRRHPGKRRSGAAQGRNVGARPSCSARRSRKRRSFPRQRCSNARTPGGSQHPRRRCRLSSPLHHWPLRPSHRLLPIPSQAPHPRRSSSLRLLPCSRAPPRHRNRGARCRPPRWQRPA